MRIRKFQPSDLPVLSKIDEECFPPGISYSREELAGYISFHSSATWVAEDNGSIIGFLVANWEPGRVGHIITIDILRHARRQGTGARLMKVAEEWASKARLRIIYLETAENNLAAQHFYEALGYRKLEKVERYYNNGQAAWVMVKSLK